MHQNLENICSNGMLLLHLKLKNITVFSGWDDNNMLEGDPHREFDFLIVSDLSKTIIHIEVKHSNQENNKPLKKAIKQVNITCKNNKCRKPLTRYCIHVFNYSWTRKQLESMNYNGENIPIA